MTKNPYEILGVSQNSSEDEIKKAYKKLALEHHPDKFTDENEKKLHEEKFKEINEAYQQITKGTQFQPDFNPWRHTDDFGGGFNFNDFLSDFFGSRSNQKQQTAHITFSVDELINGVTKEFVVSKHMKCDKCNGDPFHNKRTCEKCNGNGRVYEKQGGSNSFFVMAIPCSNCRGMGFTFESTCDKCKGSGKQREDKKYSVKVKAREIK